MAMNFAVAAPFRKFKDFGEFQLSANLGEIAIKRAGGYCEVVWSEETAGKGRECIKRVWCLILDLVAMEQDPEEFRYVWDGRDIVAISLYGNLEFRL